MEQNQAGGPLTLLQKRIHEIEADLGLNPGFHDSLFLEGDEWSFVIKAHALVEAALTHLLTQSFQDTGIADYLAEKRYAEKAVICKHALLLHQDTFVFVKCLGELRNDLVHDVRQTAFTFREYASEAQTPNSLVERRLRGLIPRNEGLTPQPKSTPEVRSLVANHGRHEVWMGVMVVMLNVYASRSDVRMKRSDDAVRRVLLNQMGDNTEAQDQR
jgi:hypothetical protein